MSTLMSSVICSHFNMQEEDIIKHANTMCHVFILVVKNVNMSMTL